MACASSPLRKSATLILIVALLSCFNLAPVFAEEQQAQPVSGTASAAASDNGSSPTVVRELVDRRTENSTHYLMSDGRQRAVISEVPVRFRRSNGTWSAVDRSLVAAGANRYATKATSITASFECTESGRPLVTFSGRTWSMSIDLVGANAGVLTALGDKATYSGVAQDADLTYETMDDGVKETLVLASAAAPATYTFHLTLDGVRLNTLPSGGYVLVDSAGREVYHMGSLEVVDSTSGADGPARCNGARMDVVQSGRDAWITCVVDKEWLAAPDRVFPVRVDPTFTSMFDTYVCSGTAYRDMSFGTSTELHAGHWNNTTGYRRAYTFFDVSSITTSTEIYAATYSAYQFATYDTGTRLTYLARATTAWDESTTWNTKPGYTYISYQNAQGGARWVNWNIKTTVCGWVDGTTDNHGLCMYQQENGTQDLYWWRKFYSSEVSNASLRPKLVIDYNSLPANVTNLATSSSNQGLSWWRASSPTAPNDLPEAGRGKVTLQWSRPARANGYHVWMFDGSAYRQVADIADPRHTTWSSSDAQLYPPDSEISSWPEDGKTSDPFYLGANPGDA